MVIHILYAITLFISGSERLQISEAYGAAGLPIDDFLFNQFYTILYVNTNLVN